MWARQALTAVTCMPLSLGWNAGLSILCWPGFRSELRHLGQIYLEEKVHVHLLKLANAVGKWDLALFHTAYSPVARATKVEMADISMEQSSAPARPRSNLAVAASMDSFLSENGTHDVQSDGPQITGNFSIPEPEELAGGNGYSNGVGSAEERSMAMAGFSGRAQAAALAARLSPPGARLESYMGMFVTPTSELLTDAPEVCSAPLLQAVLFNEDLSFQHVTALCITCRSAMPPCDMPHRL